MYAQEVDDDDEDLEEVVELELVVCVESQLVHRLLGKSSFE